jgi:hypothetical protein
MFCPSCGSNEKLSQFCRACGTDLRSVRTSLERPDSLTAIAVTAREEIGRAVAEKIREVEGSHDLKQVAEDVLPKIEKFLESPEEKRLRRMRAGVITAASGAGACVTGLVLAAIIYGNVGKALTMGGAGLGFLIFLVGLGLVLNGVWFTGLRKGVEDHSSDADSQNQLDAGYAPSQLRSSGEAHPSFRSETSNLSEISGSSVTEGTTHHLVSKR